MKEKLLNFTFCLLCFCSLIVITINNNAAKDVILNATNLFLTKVFVSLFPMFIINDLLINLNFAYFFYKIFNHIFKLLFNSSGVLSYIMIMSLLSGTPTNAYIIASLESEGKISIEEANHYLYFTYFSNPLFLFTMLLVIFPINIVIKLILIHYLSNIIIALLLRRKAPKITQNEITFSNPNIGSTLIKSISRSINTLLMILGTIVFYMLLTFIISNTFNLNNLGRILVSGFLEITSGLNNLSQITLSVKLKEIIALFIISFGGLSIHTQIKSILEDTNIDYKYFLKGRIMQAVISVILGLIL